MSYLTMLLSGDWPLEDHERHDLADWLLTLQKDCEWFGETAEDTALMRRINARLSPPPPASPSIGEAIDS